MNRYRLFDHRLLIIVIITIGWFAGCSPKSKLKPNILWILAEDLSQDLNCYGNSLVKTPVLDRLAKDGTRFTNVFTTAAVCTPSRTALATGMYQTSINAYHMRYPDSLKNPLPASVLPINELFRRNGYQTANIKDKPGTGKTDWSFQSEYEKYDCDSWDQLDGEKPFFAVVNLRLTHRPFEKDHENPIDPNLVTLPPYYPDHTVARTDWAAYLESVQLLDRQVAMVLDEIGKRGWKDNTIVIFFSDHGRPFTRAKTFLYDSGVEIPLIISCPDGLGWEMYLPKGSISDELISAIDLSATSLSFAGISRPENMQGRIIAGPKKDEPRAFVYGASDRIGEVYFKSRSVRSDRFKYIKNYHHGLSVNEASTAYRKAMHPIYQLMDIMAERGQLDDIQQQLVVPQAEEELYDIQADPYEINNLINDPAHKPELIAMQKQLAMWQKETIDYGMKNDIEELAAAFSEYGKQSNENYALKAATLREEIIRQIDHSDQ
jgi:uncharacterized sulfatase